MQMAGTLTGMACLSLVCLRGYVVPGREVCRSGNTALYLTILDEDGLNQKLCSDFSLPIEHFSFGSLLGAFPAQGTIPSSTGLNTVCWHRECNIQI